MAAARNTLGNRRTEYFPFQNKTAPNEWIELCESLYARCHSKGSPKYVVRFFVEGWMRVLYFVYTLTRYATHNGHMLSMPYETVAPILSYVSRQHTYNSPNHPFCERMRIRCRQSNEYKETCMFDATTVVCWHFHHFLRRLHSTDVIIRNG